MNFLTLQLYKCLFLHLLRHIGRDQRRPGRQRDRVRLDLALGGNVLLAVVCADQHHRQLLGDALHQAKVGPHGGVRRVQRHKVARIAGLLPGKIS